MKPARFITTGVLYLGLSFILWTCTETPPENVVQSTPILPLEVEPTPIPEKTKPASQSQVEPLAVDPVFGFVHQRANGNPTIAGSGSFPQNLPADLQLDGRPQWLVAAPFQDGSLWVAVLENGQVQAVYVTDSSIVQNPIDLKMISPGGPPILEIVGEMVSLGPDLPQNKSALTFPVPVPGSSDTWVFIDQVGDLVLWSGAEIGRLAISALPDARILTDDAGRLLVLTDPTDRYTHGVLGDSIEACGIILVETSPDFRIATKIVIDPPAVVEGIAPLWADLNGDGQREIIVTQSDAVQGAQIVVYGEDGNFLAAGPAIDLGYRWRHQLAVAPFGPDGQTELAVVKTPHIGGVVEFYRLRGDQLEIVAQISGFSTHTIGSRNLNNALAGDFDGDGQFELLVPDQSHARLSAIRRTSGGVELAWQLPLGGAHTTNWVALELPNGKIAVGIGTKNEILRIWIP